MTTSQISERVQRGAALLDTKFPGWADQVNLGSLDLESPCDCILGQRFGDFTDGAHSLELAGTPTVAGLSEAARSVLEAHGFLVNIRDDEWLHETSVNGNTYRSLDPSAGDRISDSYAELTLVWAKLITDRRAQTLLVNM